MRDELVELGYTVLAIAPDRPAKVAETRRKLKLEFEVYSDASAEAIRAFGLGFVQGGERYGQLLEEWSGEDHHVLPVPAVILVDSDRAIRFLHADPRYQQRLPAELLVAAARAWEPEEAD